MFNPIRRAAVALLAAPAPATPTPTFNAGVVHTALVYIAASVIGALGIYIMVKYSKRGEVGEATNSMLVIGMGAFLVVGAATVLVFGQLISNATVTAK